MDTLYLELNDVDGVEELDDITVEEFLSMCSRSTLMNIKSIKRYVSSDVSTIFTDGIIRVKFEELDVKELIRQNMVKYLN